MILVLDLHDRRPVWAMPDWVPRRIEEVVEETGGGEVRMVDVPADGSGDGLARAHPEVLAAVEDADAYLGYGVPAEVLRRGRRLRWVHSGAAGVGGSLTPELRSADVVFTNSAGIHGPPMAETVIGMILHFFRGLDLAVRGQVRSTWDTGPFYRADAPVRELSRATVGIVGLGGTGREVARRCAALGARVVAVRRTAEADHRLDLETVGGGAALGGAVEVWAGEDALERMARAVDVLVVAAPETPETRGMIHEGVLALLSPDAVLINVARGGLVVEDALVEALSAGRLRGAALDVVDEEPLPDDHPLWTLENVLLTPHVSAVTDAFWERETELITENVRRLREGRTLRNVVDVEAGY